MSIKSQIKAIKQKKLDAIESARREKEVQTKISIRKTLNNMKSLSTKLDSFKQDYIAKARQALLINNKQSYALAKQGLKLCVSKQRFIDSMVANFEIALQMNEMNKVINEFVGGMNLISEEMKGITSTIDISKAQAAYETALANNENQYEALDAFLKEAEGSIESISSGDNGITDAELDKLIDDQAVEAEAQYDLDIDQKINEIRNKLTI